MHSTVLAGQRVLQAPFLDLAPCGPAHLPDPRAYFKPTESPASAQFEDKPNPSSSPQPPTPHQARPTAAPVAVADPPSCVGHTLPTLLPDFSVCHPKLQICMAAMASSALPNSVPSDSGSSDSVPSGKPKVLSILGMPGSGKTTLALQVAHQLASRAGHTYPGGVRLLDLGCLSLMDGEGAVRALLGALKTTPAAMDEVTAGGADQAGMGYGEDKVSVVVLTHAEDVSLADLRRLLCAALDCGAQAVWTGFDAYPDGSDRDHTTTKPVGETSSGAGPRHSPQGSNAPLPDGLSQTAPPPAALELAQEEKMDFLYCRVARDDWALCLHPVVFGVLCQLRECASDGTDGSLDTCLEMLTKVLLVILKTLPDLPEGWGGAHDLAASLQQVLADLQQLHTMLCQRQHQQQHQQQRRQKRPQRQQQQQSEQHGGQCCDIHLTEDLTHMMFLAAVTFSHCAQLSPGLLEVAIPVLRQAVDGIHHCWQQEGKACVAADVVLELSTCLLRLGRFGEALDALSGLMPALERTGESVAGARLRIVGGGLLVQALLRLNRQEEGVQACASLCSQVLRCKTHDPCAISKLLGEVLGSIEAAVVTAGNAGATGKALRQHQRHLLAWLTGFARGWAQASLDSGGWCIRNQKLQLQLECEKAPTADSRMREAASDAQLPPSSPVSTSDSTTAASHSQLGPTTPSPTHRPSSTCDTSPGGQHKAAGKEQGAPAGKGAQGQPAPASDVGCPTEANSGAWQTAVSRSRTSATNRCHPIFISVKLHAGSDDVGKHDSNGGSGSNDGSSNGSPTGGAWAANTAAAGQQHRLGEAGGTGTAAAAASLPAVPTTSAALGGGLVGAELGDMGCSVASPTALDSCRLALARTLVKFSSGIPVEAISLLRLVVGWRQARMPCTAQLKEAGVELMAWHYLSTDPQASGLPEDLDLGRAFGDIAARVGALSRVLDSVRWSRAEGEMPPTIDNTAGVLREALDLITSVLGGRHRLVVEYKAQLAKVLCVQAGSQPSAWGEARSLWREVLADRQQRLGPDHDDTVEVMQQLAKSLGGQRVKSMALRAEAAELWRQVHAHQERTLGPTHEDTMYTASQLGCDLVGSRQLEAAAPVLQELEAMCRVKGVQFQPVETMLRWCIDKVNRMSLASSASKPARNKAASSRQRRAQAAARSADVGTAQLSINPEQVAAAAAADAARLVAAEAAAAALLAEEAAKGGRAVKKAGETKTKKKMKARGKVDRRHLRAGDEREQEHCGQGQGVATPPHKAATGHGPVKEEAEEAPWAQAGDTQDEGFMTDKDVVLATVLAAPSIWSKFTTTPQAAAAAAAAAQGPGSVVFSKGHNTVTAAAQLCSASAATCLPVMSSVAQAVPATAGCAERCGMDPTTSSALRPHLAALPPFHPLRLAEDSMAAAVLRLAQAGLVTGAGAQAGQQQQKVPLVLLAGAVGPPSLQQQQLSAVPVLQQIEPAPPAVLSAPHGVKVECCVCLDMRTPVTFQPCGHAICCKGCAGQVAASVRPLCPFCDMLIKSVTKL